MSPPRFPRMFGKYLLLRLFAKGGMGEIYLASQSEMAGVEKLCLIKKLPDRLDSKGSQGAIGRLLDEAKVSVRLNHTNIVQVFDAGMVQGELYIAMELIEGRDLRAVWNRTAERRSRIPLDVALYVVREMARGLDYAHNYGSIGLVHRDIAPPNILISWHGEVKVGDFGLARSVLKNERTAPGVVYGRIAYLAPEQARGEQADARTDVFATGVVLWELLTGRPFREVSEDAVKNLEQARHPVIKAPSTLIRTVPTTLDAVVLRALAPEREARYPTAEALRKDVGDELAKIAPGTDATRLAVFVRDLFSDDITRENQERERLLRDELPKYRETMGAPLKHPTLPPRGAPPPPPKSDAEIDAEWESPTVERRPSKLMDAKAANDALDEFSAPMPTNVDTGKKIPPPPEELAPEATRIEAQPSAPQRPAAPRPPERAEDRAMQELVGKRVDGRYQVLRVIGTGGMGAVYEAEHVDIGKKVAMKILRPEYSRQADLVARFRKEARAASMIGHPNIVDVTDSGTLDNGNVYFVMERLTGMDLADLLRHETRLAPDRAVRIGVQICKAVAAAHTAGVIHRDLKPENVFLVDRDGNADFVKVLDFGIAKHDVGNQNSLRRVAAPSVPVGTPEYMAPEQAAGLPIDGRVDVYAVGTMLYEMLSGRTPFIGEKSDLIIGQKTKLDPPPLQSFAPEIGGALARVIDAAVKRDPNARPQTMGAFEYELIKSAQGRGSAVAAVLGIKNPDTGPIVWDEGDPNPAPVPKAVFNDVTEAPRASTTKEVTMPPTNRRTLILAVSFMCAGIAATTIAVMRHRRAAVMSASPGDAGTFIAPKVAEPTPKVTEPTPKVVGATPKTPNGAPDAPPIPKGPQPPPSKTPAAIATAAANDAQALAAQKNYAAAITRITDGVNATPTDVRLLRARGDYERAAEQYGEAVVDYRRVLKLKPKDHAAMLGERAAMTAYKAQRKAQKTLATRPGKKKH